MSSKKRSSWSKQKAEFNASLGGMDNLFASEGKRQQKNRAEKEAALRKKACESKNRYTSKSDAEAEAPWEQYMSSLFQTQNLSIFLLMQFIISMCPKVPAKNKCAYPRSLL